MNLTPQQPKWLSRSDPGRQPFVLTLCSAGDVDIQLQTVEQTLGNEIAVSERTRRDERCYELIVECSPKQAWDLQQDLRGRLDDSDVYLQPGSATPIRMLVCDMDMTIVAAETLDEVAEVLGMGERIAEITARAMRGELDFDDALRERIRMLRGQPEQAFHDVAAKLQLNPGASELIAAAKAAGVYCVLVSGGFTQVAEPVAQRLGFDDVFCNDLEVVDGLLDGTVNSPIINADFKCRILQRCAFRNGLRLSECCAIGDGANDLPMMLAAGLGIGYRAKPLLHAAVSCHIDTTDLSSAIHFMRLDQA